MSLSLNLGQKSGTDLSNSLLPEQTNLSDWLTQPTTDGKTLVNVKGTDTTLTNINCIDFENSDDDEVVSDASIAPTGDWYVECFYYPDSHINFAEVILTNSSDQYIGTNSTTGQLRARIGATAYATSASNTIPTGEWSRIVSQRSGSNVTFTVYEANGTQRWTETLSASSTALTAGTLKLGGIFSGRTIDGKLAHVKVGNSSTDIIAHYPLAEGSGTKVYDISGQGNHATSASVSYTGLSGITSHNHQYGFTGNSLLKVPVLENKTKQAITLDGSNDVISFGSTISVTDFVYTSKFKLETTAGNNNVFFSSGSDSSSAMFMTLDGSRLGFQIGGNTIQNFPDGSGDGSDTLQRFIVAGYKTSDSQTGTVNLRDGNVHTVVLTRSGTTIAVDIDDGTVTGTFINMPTDAMTFTQFGKQMTHGAYVKGTIYSSKLEAGGSVVHEFNLEENIGTTTIKDSSTNSNDGTLSNATLSSAWGQRIVDSTGSIVGADYAVGNTSISNSSGYVHNGSECGLDLITTDVSASDIASINNASATQTFAKRDATNSDLVIQLLQYSSALSDAGELARTRAYVS